MRVKSVCVSLLLRERERESEGQNGSLYVRKIIMRVSAEEKNKERKKERELLSSFIFMMAFN